MWTSPSAGHVLPRLARLCRLRAPFARDGAVRLACGAPRSATPLTPYLPPTLSSPHPSLLCRVLTVLDAFSLFSAGKEKLDAETLEQTLGKFGIQVANAHELLPEPVDFTQFSIRMAEYASSPKSSPKAQRNGHGADADTEQSKGAANGRPSSLTSSAGLTASGQLTRSNRHIHNMEPGDVVEEAKDYFIERNGVRFAGTHLIIDLYGAQRLGDLEHIEATFFDCIAAAKATLLDMNLHHFTPNGGVSGVAVLAESHISIHSWPEHEYAALDIFTCGASEPHNAIEVLRAAFQPTRLVVEEHLRGRSEQTTWFEERLHAGYRVKLETDTIIYDSGNDLQRSVVFEHARLGRVLMIDDVVQTTEADEFVYHECMAHVPILAHGHAKRVLVIGGGDGGMVEEVLKHADVERVVMVEIDRAVVDLAERFLPSIHGGAFADPRMELVIADGYEFVHTTAERFDVILVDSCDPVGPASILFTEEFYRRCHGCLTPGGVLVTQSGTPFWQGGELTDTYRHMTPVFADAACFVAAVPLYVGGFMAFGWGSDSAALRDVPLATLEARYAAAALTTKYYSPAVHRGAFALPPYVQALLC